MSTLLLVLIILAGVVFYACIGAAAGGYAWRREKGYNPDHFIAWMIGVAWPVTIPFGLLYLWISHPHRSPFYRIAKWVHDYQKPDR